MTIDKKTKRFEIQLNEPKQNGKPTGLNDYFEFYFIISNFINFKFTILGYGITIRIMLKDSIKELVGEE